jgi:hypothetical protein
MRVHIQRGADRYTQGLRQMRFLTVNARQDIDDKIVHFKN